MLDFTKGRPQERGLARPCEDWAKTRLTAPRAAARRGAKRKPKAPASAPKPKMRRAAPKLHPSRACASASSSRPRLLRLRWRRRTRKTRRQSGRGDGPARSPTSCGASFMLFVFRVLTSIMRAGCCALLARGMSESSKPACAAWRRAGARFTPGRALLLGQMAPRVGNATQRLEVRTCSRALTRSACASCAGTPECAAGRRARPRRSPPPSRRVCVVHNESCGRTLAPSSESHASATPLRPAGTASTAVALAALAGCLGVAHYAVPK